eukprot:464436-Alexandrium_andersonii.AAC.1
MPFAPPYSARQRRERSPLPPPAFLGPWAMQHPGLDARCAPLLRTTTSARSSGAACAPASTASATNLLPGDPPSPLLELSGSRHLSSRTGSAACPLRPPSAEFR